MEKDSPAQAEHSDESQESGITRASFSSLINYDPSSQLGTGTAFARLPAKTTMTTRPTTQAELLRLRLKLAMYKLRTNQLYVPFQRLQIHRPAQKRVIQQMLDPALSPASSDMSELPTRGGGPSESPEDGTPRPKLRQTPVLLPTAYSSRLVFGPPLHREAESVEALR